MRGIFGEQLGSMSFFNPRSGRWEPVDATTEELLTLLRDVDNERVVREWHPDGAGVDIKGRAPVRMVEAEAAGWVSLSGVAWCSADIWGQDWHWQLWQLTDAGRAVLDGAS